MQRPFVVVKQTRSWTVTVDLAYPSGLSEIADEAIHRLLDSVEHYRGALNVGRGRRCVAITLSIDDADLYESTFQYAGALGEAIVRDQLAALGYEEPWLVESIEVSSTDEHHILHLIGSTTSEL